VPAAENFPSPSADAPDRVSWSVFGGEKKSFAASARGQNKEKNPETDFSFFLFQF